jgi:hypothetical protein
MGRLQQDGRQVVGFVTLLHLPHRHADVPSMLATPCPRPSHAEALVRPLFSRHPIHAHSSLAAPHAEALARSQALGEEGDVDQALMLSQQADAYKKQKDEMHKRLTAPDRIMTVCDTCGVFINSTDNEARRMVRALRVHVPHAPSAPCVLHVPSPCTLHSPCVLIPCAVTCPKPTSPTCTRSKHMPSPPLARTT